jgi:hypothetical protein
MGVSPVPKNVGRLARSKKCGMGVSPVPKNVEWASRPFHN